VRCSFCRTALYVRAAGPLVYHWPLMDPPPGLVWLPYWRFRGLWYRVRERSTEGILLDSTVNARRGVREGSGLGIRPQVVPFRMGVPEAGRVLWPDLSLGDAVAVSEARVEGLSAGPAPVRRLVGEVAAVLWAPFALERAGEHWGLTALFPDGPSGLLDRPEALGLRKGLDEPPREWRPRFLALRCPECGDDLPTVAHAVGFWCGRCGRGWWPRGTGLAPLPFTVREVRSSEARYLPFWELEISARGLPFRSRAGLVRWAVPYWRTSAGDDGRPAVVRIPAFKAHPRLFLRIGRNLTLADLPAGEHDRLPPAAVEVEPARLPLGEAAQSLKPVLAELVGTQYRKRHAVLTARLRVRRAGLVLLPFQRQGGEWVEEATGAAVPAAALERGRGI
ncbi:MAG: hypothetical protein GXP50_05380, partial [Deltaproteobacteria bacterium]|nr:hypothetical protein [Deltaproteobacteria bacterium]